MLLDRISEAEKRAKKEKAAVQRAKRFLKFHVFLSD